MKLSDDYDEEFVSEGEDASETGKGNLSQKKVNILKIITIYIFLAVFSWYLFQFVFESELFSIKDIDVQGNEHLKQNDVFNKSEIQFGYNIFLLNTKKIISELKTNPWILDAEIKKIYPDKLIIFIKERKASAIVDIGQNSYEISKDGIILYCLTHVEKDNLNLPCISGLKSGNVKIGEKIIEPDFRSALEIIYCVEVILPKIFCEVKIVDSGDFLVCSKIEPFKIRVARAEEIIDKENLIREALERIKKEKLQVDYLDLRFQDSLVIKKK